VARLTATDALFAYAHTPEVPMNMGSVQVLTLPPGYKGDYFADFKAFIAERLDYLPKIKKRLVIDTLGLPSWVDVEDFDLDYHIRRTRVRSTSERDLAHKLGRLQHLPFDFDKPLFMFYVIEGLADGKVAIMQKFHHAFADGKTAVRMMDLFSDEGLESVPRLEDIEDHLDDEGGVVTRTLAGCVEDVRRTWNSLSGLAGGGRKMLNKDGRAMLDRIRSRPVTVFNQPLSEKRLFATRVWSLDELNAVRRAAGLTFNDMGLVLLGGALQRYLDELDALPQQSLVCNVPVALQVEGSGGGNAVMAIWVPMGTHLSDRRERIAHVKAEADDCKQFLTGVLEGVAQGGGVELPSFMVRMMAMPLSSQWLAKQNPPPGNVALSNVPAPAAPIHVAGAKVEALFGMPMLLQAQAISTTFSSYAGTVVSSILCCEEALPDPERIFQYMDEELNELRKLYGVKAGPGKKRTAARKKTAAKKKPAARKKAATKKKPAGRRKGKAA
jgi:WS/DGAT/MGAT family acyltransferase